MPVLDGIRVLDFGRYVAGPWCAALLGDFGADVIRIERRRGGEDRYITPLTAEGEGALLLQSNRNKRSITLDPGSEAGREVVRRLVRTADVVVVNLPPQALAAIGIDYPTLSALKPDIILTLVTAYGAGGPLSNHVGFDGVAQAMSGAAWFSGEPDHPVRTAVPYTDFLAATNSAFGTLLALMERQKTGRGQVVEASLLGAALTLANGHIMEQAVRAPNRQPTGNRSQAAAPSDLFRTADGWIVVQVVGNSLFARLAQLIGDEQLANDERFKTDLSRGIHGAEISRIVGGWCAQRGTADLLRMFGNAGIPAGPVLDFTQALAHPHVMAAGFFQLVDYPGLPRPAPVSTSPVRLSDSPGSIRHSAPTLGADTDEVLIEIGFSPEDIAMMRRSAAI